MHYYMIATLISRLLYHFILPEDEQKTNMYGYICWRDLAYVTLLSCTNKHVHVLQQDIQFVAQSLGRQDDLCMARRFKQA